MNESQQKLLKKLEKLHEKFQTMSDEEWEELFAKLAKIPKEEALQYAKLERALLSSDDH